MANLLLMGKTQQRLVREGGLDIDGKKLPPRWDGEVMDYNTPSHCFSSGNNSPTGFVLTRITDLCDHRIFNPVNSAFGQKLPLTA